MSDRGYTQTISTAGFTGTPSLLLEQPTGDVTVEGWDRPEIQISVSDEGIFEIEQSGSQVVVKNRPGKFKLVDFLEPIDEELHDLGLDLTKVASRVERSVERSVKNMKKMGRHVNIDVDLSNWRGGRDYRMKVPHDCDLRLRTSSGDIMIAGVTGTLDLQSTSGDVRVSDIGGNILIASSSGDVGIESLRGKLAVRSSSGDIRTHNLGVNEVSASTASGDLDLDLNRLPEGNFDVKTISGDLNLFVPAQAAFRADVHTISGSVRCGFPREAVEYSASHKRETTLKINGGGRNLQINTVSGDVSIRPTRAEYQQSGNATRQTSPGSNFGWSSNKGGAPTMDLSRNQNPAGQSGSAEGSHGDITKAESYAARQQAELAILQQVEKGELSPEEALAALAALDGQ